MNHSSLDNMILGAVQIKEHEIFPELDEDLEFGIIMTDSNFYITEFTEKVKNLINVSVKTLKDYHTYYGNQPTIDDLFYVPNQYSDL